MDKGKSIYVNEFMTEEESQNATKPRKRDRDRFEKKRKDFDLERVISDFVIRKELFISNQSGDIRTHYNIAKTPLGEGAFGVVYLGTEIESRQKRAIKVIEKKMITNIERFHNEVNALKTLDHPNIIKLFEIFMDKKKVYLVQELCTGGELFDFIVEKEFLTEDIAAKIFSQIMRSLMY